MESDIVTRVNAIQKELQRIQYDLIHIVRDFKENFIFRTQRDFKVEEKRYLKFSKNMTERISTVCKVNSSNSKDITVVSENDELIRKNINECEACLKQLKNFNFSFKERLSNISIKINDDWQPDTSIIGRLNGTNITKFLLKLVHNKPTVINIENESVHGICNLFDQNLLITCVDTNKLIQINKSYNITKVASEIGDLKFNCPLGICHNNEDSIYICDLMNHRVVIVDRQLRLKRLIGGSASNELGKFDRPVDCCFYGGNLYVLDCRNKRIQEFNADGDFKREIKLIKIAFDIDKRASLISTDENAYQKRPLRLDVTEDSIAVIDDYEELFIYNFAGDLKQMIKKCRLMCFVDTYLFTCDDHGLLMCYEKYKMNGYDEYLPLFKRKIEILQPPISFMRFFNGHLTISLGGSKKGIAIF